MKYIIIAAGEQTRWNNYLNTTKHMVVLNGEVLIERIIRLLKENGIKKEDIIVVSKNYRTSGTDVYPKLNYEQNADADKFLSSKDYWDKNDRTVIIYGDVYFTEEAIKSIVSYKEQDWKLFCRPTPSNITGTKWGEIFAISLYPKDHNITIQKLNHIAMLHKTKKIDRCGGWELVRAMMNKPDSKIRKPHIIESPLYFIIDDETDDIDYPDDYERLKKVLESKK